MWLSKSEYWHEDVNLKDKFFIEKVLQLCDFNEGISNRHRTTNGFILIKELKQLTELTLKRPKSLRGLLSRFIECKSTDLRNSVVKDVIIEKYFDDLKKFITDFDTKTLSKDKRTPNNDNLKSLIHNLILFEHQLERHYFERLSKEILDYDVDVTHFGRSINGFESLIELYIPYLIFIGFSVSGLRNNLTFRLERQQYIGVEKMLEIWNGEQRQSHITLILSDLDDEISDFAYLLQDDYKITIVSEGDDDYNSLANGHPYLSMPVKTVDVVNEVRSIYDRVLKRLVVRKSRESLKSFNSFFENAYWSFPNQTYFIHCKLKGDPIAVKERKKTLMSTVNFFRNSNKQLDSLPNIKSKQLYNSIYYYNLALGSKSIENSLSLLWTSLESCLPYRVEAADVENVQAIVSKLLSIGCMNRDLYYFIERLRRCSQENTDAEINLPKYLNRPSKKSDFLNLYKWIGKENIPLFEKVKSISELTASEYHKSFHFYGNCKSDRLLERLNRSRKSIELQIRRIYMHRNNIVHAGDFISEYTNLWSHTEYYTGKLLAIQVIFEGQNKDLAQELRRVESDYDYLHSYLKQNRNKKIIDLPERIKQILAEQLWQI
jgi:hypothetical protein